MASRIGLAVTALLLITSAQSHGSDRSAPPDLQVASSVVQQSLDSQLSAAANAMRAKGMSEKGISIVVAGLRSEQHEQLRIFNETSQQRREIDAAIAAQPFNPVRFEMALKRLRDNQVAAQSVAFNAQIAVFRALPPRDQRIFAEISFAGNVRVGMPARPMIGAR